MCDYVSVMCEKSGKKSSISVLLLWNESETQLESVVVTVSCQTGYRTKTTQGKGLGTDA